MPNSECIFISHPQGEAAIRSICRGLFGNYCHNVLVTGDSGVGKSSLVEELGRRAMSGTIPALVNASFIFFDCLAIDERNSGEWLSAIFHEWASQPNVILCFDNCGQLFVGANASNNRAIILRAARSAVRLIAVCRNDQYTCVIANNADMHEHFTRVVIDEPCTEAATRIVEEATRSIHNRSGIKIDDTAAFAAVTLTASYILNDRLPAKAIKVLHHACDTAAFERLYSPSNADPVITRDDIMRAVSFRTRITQGLLDGPGDNFGEYAWQLRQRVVGQDHALTRVSDELKLIKAGFGDKTRPASVMLFAGMTGTGKTELAKGIASLYSESRLLCVYTMGNFVEQHSVS
jgi:ATP-dependent Clp protease ATP-binding subunit ClpA